MPEVTTATPVSRPSKEETLKRFQKFDAAFAAELEHAPPRTYKESYRHIAALISVLPQREHIKGSDIDRWINMTTYSAKKRMEILHGEDQVKVSDVHNHVLWHVRRASGFGGSELGTVVKHFSGKRGNFNSLHDLVRDKLLQTPPSPPTRHMKRGLRAEEFVREMYLKENNLQTHEEALEKTRLARWDGAPFLIGTPDEVLPGSNGPRSVIVPDYKVPSSAVGSKYDEKGIDDEYLYQTHGYGIILLSLGYKPESVRLVVFKDEWEFSTFDAPFEPKRASEILKATNQAWNSFVMTGTVPEAPETKKLTCENPHLMNAALRVMAMKMLEDQVKSRKEELIDAVALSGEDEFGDRVGNVNLYIGDIRRKHVYDDDMLLHIAAENDVDIDQFRKVTNTVDHEAVAAIVPQIMFALSSGASPEEQLAQVQSLVAPMQDGLPNTSPVDMAKLQAEMEARGIDLTRAREKIQSGVYVSQKKSGPIAEQVAQVRGQMANAMVHFEDAVRKGVDQLILGRSLENATTEVQDALSDEDKADIEEMTPGDIVAALSGIDQDRFDAKVQAELDARKAEEKAKKDAERAEREAEKERERQRKAEEKERERKRKAEEREAAKKQREAERERKKAEAAAKKKASAKKATPAAKDVSNAAPVDEDAVQSTPADTKPADIAQEPQAETEASLETRETSEVAMSAETADADLQTSFELNAPDDDSQHELPMPLM